MHRKHIGLIWPLNQQRYDLLSQKQESSTAYSTRISKVQVLNDQALFLCWPRMDQGGLQFAWQNALLSDDCFCYTANFLS